MGQFIFKKRVRKFGETEYEFQQRIKSIHRLHVDESKECYKGMALIVFCGLAEDYNFDEEQTAEYLGINLRLYNLYLGKYNSYLSQSAEVMKKKRLDPSKPYGKMFTKLGLVRNYLRSQKIYFSQN